MAGANGEKQVTKYLIYADGAKPIRKMKRENEAIAFASDFRNLSEYGCMTVVMVTDNSVKYVWDHEAGSWEVMEEVDIGSND